MGRELFQPDIVVVVQAGLVIVDEDRCGDVHRVDENEAFRNATFVDAFLDIGCYVDKCSPGRHVEPQFFSIALHSGFPFPITSHDPATGLRSSAFIDFRVYFQWFEL
jgi:hypothetical protein